MEHSAPLTLVWFRNDLRLHDNAILFEALKRERALLLLYCFDPGWNRETNYGFPRMGSLRARFLYQTLDELNRQLRNDGGKLVVKYEKPEKAIAGLVEKYPIAEVFTSSEVASEELQQEERVRDKLGEREIPFRLVWNKTLYHPDDMPFPYPEMPDTFGQFRKPLEKKSAIRDEVPSEELIKDAAFVTEEPSDSLPELESFIAPGVPDEAVEPDERAVIQFTGGETAALERLHHYFWEADELKNYKFKRNGLLGANYSSKFSPWLAVGALSPRRIYREVKKYEDQRKKNVSTYWLIFELIWRDSFTFLAGKYGDRLFYSGGLRGANRSWSEDPALFRVWQRGETGIPFVDANMRELYLTGYISNRGRQNVASFLSQNLAQDWRKGAAWFEHCLLDYDVGSNWGNWAYNSAVGTDPRQRYFHVINQAKKYDKKGEFVVQWIPELGGLEGEGLREPWLIPGDQLSEAGIDETSIYRNPVIDLEESFERLREQNRK